jgi:hypothetical protein
MDDCFRGFKPKDARLEAGSLQPGNPSILSRIERFAACKVLLSG